MNRGGIPRHRLWGHVFTSAGRETNRCGHPPGRAAATLGAQAWPRPTEIRDASMTPPPGTYEAGGSTIKLLRADAPIDRKRVPGDVLGLVGEQPDDRISDLFGLANPPHRDK